MVGLLFLLATFLSPLAAAVPAYATAGALIYVAILMLSGMEKLNWNDQSQLLPALVMIVMIPLTFSIANGIALGFLAYVAIQTFIGQIKQISSGAWFLTLILLLNLSFSRTKALYRLHHVALRLIYHPVHSVFINQRTSFVSRPFNNLLCPSSYMFIRFYFQEF